MKTKIATKRKPVKRKPVKKRLRTTAGARSVAEDALFDEEPNMRLSRAFVVVLALHIVAVGGILVFNKIKASEYDDREMAKKPLYGNPQVVKASSTPQQLPASATAALGQGGKVYHVRAGDTLTKIARLHGIGVQRLATANGLTQSMALQVDQRMVIPARTTQLAPHLVSQERVVRTAPQKPAVVKSTPVRTQSQPVSEMETYVVVAGDNPNAIARQFKVNYQELLKLNNITDPRLLQIGTKLKIPTAKTQ